jgi:NADPH-dependent curcumin reductase CurA
VLVNGATGAAGQIAVQIAKPSARRGEGDCNGPHKLSDAAQETAARADP